MAELKTNRVATVEILGSEYRLTGEDEDYLKQLAQYVDIELRSCSENGMVYSSGKLGILTSLNIADQLFKLKRQQKETTTQSLEIISRLIDKIDKTIEHLEHNDDKHKIEPTEANCSHQ